MGWLASHADIVMSTAQAVFVATLIVPLVTKSRFPRWTSGPTALALYAMAFTMLDLGLTRGAFMATLTATLWLLIFIYRPLRGGPDA